MRSAALAVVAFALPAAAEDAGKKACFADAKRLCSAEVKSLSRAKVRAFLIAHIDDTGPQCHDFMVKARAAAQSGHKPDPSAL